MNKTKVLAILKKQGRKQSWLQEQLGMTRTTFYFFLKGKRGFMDTKKRECADILGVTVDEII